MPNSSTEVALPPMFRRPALIVALVVLPSTPLSCAGRPGVKPGLLLEALLAKAWPKALSRKAALSGFWLGLLLP